MLGLGIKRDCSFRSARLVTQSKQGDDKIKIRVMVNQAMGGTGRVGSSGGRVAVLAGALTS